MRGALPSLEGLQWPERSTAELLQQELSSLRLPHFCQGESSLVEALLLDILEASSAGALKRAAWEASRLRELMEQERTRQQKARAVSASSAAEPTSFRAKGRKIVLEEAPNAATLAALHAEAAQWAKLQEQGALREGIQTAWQERVRSWALLEEVFGELAMLLGRGWDLGRGLLRSRGWLETARLRELLERLPALKQLIQALGRMRTSEDASLPPVMETVIGPMRRVHEERQEVQSPLARSETRGVERSGDVQRMLPPEAVLLGHPTLRLLWHARRAERTLLTYKVDGTELELVQRETEADEARSRASPPMTRGPILVCLDTSGSMEGTPETVAKALVLEAARVAFAEKRACYLYAFSGPGDVVEHELSLTESGLARLMAFLTHSFGGGTDVEVPLKRAVSRLDSEAWARADLLLVSDGEFAVPEATRNLMVQASARKGLRAHGVLIGAGHGDAMAALCSPVHRFNDWRALLDGP
ncbi:VWA domain-containing protein [Corallococcus macrosporus]|uniref:VWA domain-containing protein n=1 Tax=Corallococcus macrosporus TaxID=35 RepID=A0ABS3DJL1_9BACT|nr:VWA domain-containing protein [Corallococcus macrosporus]MBN8231512.1 VWA domain-containing protein [Corallococcus macrosporus]